MQPQLRLSSHAKALAIAALLHAGLVGVLLLDLHLAERRIGERDGDRTAIDVDLINTDDLARLSSAGQASAPQPILELSEPPQTNENETPADPAKTGRGLAASARQSPQTPPADRKPPDQTALAKELYDLVPDPIPMPSGPPIF